jgi:hypothetical protein
MDFRREGDHRFKGRGWGSLVLVAVFGLLLNAVFQSGHEILALVLLAAGLVAPGYGNCAATAPGLRLPASQPLLIW